MAVASSGWPVELLLEEYEIRDWSCNCQSESDCIADVVDRPGKSYAMVGMVLRSADETKTEALPYGVKGS